MTKTEYEYEQLTTSKTTTSAAAAAAAAAQKIDVGAAALEPAAPGDVVHVHRIGCLLHALHLSVNAGMETVFLMGQLGQSTLKYHGDDVVPFFLRPSLLTNDKRPISPSRLATRASCAFLPSASTSSAAWTARVFASG